MSTNSTIAIIKKDGSVEQIYAHWDGYVSYNGAVLFLHYREPQKVRELIKSGNISALQKEIYPNGAHTFDKPEEGVTTFYGRDRGDTEQMASQFSSIKEFFEQKDSQEYDYVFDELKNKWFLIMGYKLDPVSGESSPNLVPLKTLVKKEFKNLSSDLQKDFLQYEKELQSKKEHNALKKQLSLKENDTKKKKYKL